MFFQNNKNMFCFSMFRVLASALVLRRSCARITSKIDMRPKLDSIFSSSARVARVVLSNNSKIYVGAAGVVIFFDAPTPIGL